MAYWFGRFSLVAFCFIKLLCWNVCWLAGWMLDSWHFCNQFSGLWCPWVSFGMLGASTLASWRTLGRSCDDPGTVEGTGKDPVRSRLGFYWFFDDSGDPFWELFGYFWSKKEVFFHIYFQVAFSVGFWVWIWVSGLAKTRIWHGRYCKNQLSQKLDFLWFQGHFFMILGGLGTNFHGFCCLEDWLEN